MSESGAVIHRPGIEHESRAAEATHGEATATTVRLRWSAAVPALLMGAIGGGARPAAALGFVGSPPAVGCPIRNKLVVTAIGATCYFAPAQPVLTAVSRFSWSRSSQSVYARS